MLTNSDLDDIQERIDAYMRPGSRLLTNGINNDEAVELVKMARRYLWLRDNASDDTHYCVVDEDTGAWIAGDQLDMVIDSAINSQRKEGGEE